MPKQIIKGFISQIRGVSYKPTDVVDAENGTPIIRANNIQDDGMIYDDLVFVAQQRIKDNQLLKKGDIVICTSSGSKNLVGKATTFSGYKTDMSFGAFCKVVRISSSSVNPDYIRLFFKSKTYREQISASSTGANINNIKTDHIDNLIINIPPVETQNIAVRELSTLIKSISIKKQQLSALNELVKSRFIEMFGDPQNNNKQFPTKKLIDVVTLQRGHDLPVQNRDSHGSVPVYGSNGVLGFHTIAKCDRGIITGRSGTIGEVYVSEEPFWPLNTTLYSNNTHGNNLIYLKYLLMFFNLKRFKSGAGVPTLNRNEFHGKEIMDVPIELQNEFADFVKLIDKSKFVG